MKIIAHNTPETIRVKKEFFDTFYYHFFYWRYLFCWLYYSFSLRRRAQLSQGAGGKEYSVSTQE